MCHSGDADATWQLSDRYYPVPGTFEVRRCRTCRSTYVADPPEDISPWYGSFYYSYDPDPPVRSRGLKPWLKRRIRQSPAIREAVAVLPGRVDFDRRLASGATKAASRVLDLGCGNGDALEVYLAAGWSTYGVEFGHAGADACRARGHEVVVGDFTSIDLPWRDFDLVRASHVIEHVLDPIGALGKAMSLVGPGGALLVEIPNLAGALARLSGSSYWQLDPPRHLALPHRSQLITVLRANGFSDIEASTYSSGRGIATTFFMWRHQDGYLAPDPSHEVWRLGDTSVPRGYRFVELIGEPVATISDALRLGDSLRVLARRSQGGSPTP